MAIIQPDPSGLALAADHITAGGLVAFPTETVYGLGADAFSPPAVARIFAAKERPHFDPLIVHVDGPSMAGEVAAEIDDTAAAMIERWWPGPLTLVLPKRPRVPGIVTSGLETVGVRMPNHPIALSLITLAGTPIAAPSANPFGRLSPTRAEHVDRLLGERVDVILDGGPTHHGVESTIVAVGGTVRILRHGAVTQEMLTEAGFHPVVDPGDGPVTPGSLDDHYAPATPLTIAPPDECSDRGRAAALTFQSAAKGFAAARVLSPSGDLIEAAANLFEALHDLDSAGTSAIYAEPVPEIGIGRAIMDRLRRASRR